MKTQTLKMLFVMMIFLLSSCMPPTVEETAALDPTTTEVEPTSIPTEIPTAEPESGFTICTAALPASLFPYDGIHTPIKDNILSLIIEDGFDLVDGQLSPNILVKVPSEEDGDIRLEAIEVQRGQTIIDANGEMVVLKAGVEVRPSGCRNSDCVIAWDGINTLEMDQMVIDFEIKESVTWSDGKPVIAEDSVFSFNLAQAPDAPGLKWAEDRTEEYVVVDERLVRWIGRPGFTTSKIDSFFWAPLPSHMFTGSETWSDFSNSEDLSRSLLSHGPFVLEEWSEGEMQFISNSSYYRADEGLPSLERVIIKEVQGGADSALQGIQSGQCDVLDTSFKFENSPEVLSAVQDDARLNLHIEQGQSWTQLVFGIQPSSYDEFYNPVYGDRPDFFGNNRMRDAIAVCLDKERMVDELTQGMGEIWTSFVSPMSSQLSSSDVIVHDTSYGAWLLGDMGWVDYDNNPETPHQAWGVTNIPDGTPLILELLVGQSALHQSLGTLIKDSLGECGFEINLISLPASELYAPGPDGRLFGRSFDLALIDWQPMPDLDCRYYQSNAMPSAENRWVGTNIAGLNDQNYDHACSSAALALPGELESSLLNAETAYLDVLPAVPLFSTPRVMVTTTDVCINEEGFSSEVDFYRLLNEIGENCP